eukprot:gene8377-9276_t
MYGFGSSSSQVKGYKLVIDNFNYSSEPHQMTAERQNKVVNWVGLMVVENRILGNSLSVEKPSLDKLMKLENGLCIPNTVEHNQQRFNYIAICSRLAVEHINCLKDFENVVTQHIPHKYSSTMSKPTNTVFAEMIYEDENDSSGMQKVAFDSLYSPKSTSDKCTMFSDQVLVNRRNVNTDVSRKVEGCKQFFLFEVNGRIIACYCEILGIRSPDVEPMGNVILQKLSTMTNKEKKDYLFNLSAEVVDKFIIRKEQNSRIVKRQLTFKFDEKRRVEHEITHGLHTENPSSSQLIKDGMFNYQCSLLDVGMVVVNFYDAVSEGDGPRVIRCWKFMLQYLKKDGASSRKYAPEALYMVFQIYAILPEIDAHHLIWNRFHKSKSCRGGNVPQDLALEHYNNLLKSVIKNLGPNSTNTKVIDRYCKALTVNKKFLENFDRSCHVIRRSGKHVKANLSGDFKKVVLVEFHLPFMNV